MKAIKIILLSVLIFSGVSWIISAASCSKDSCKAVTCQHGGVCNGGTCVQCPNGTGGNSCEIVYRLLYANKYMGNGTDDSGSTYVKNTLTFTAGNDTGYTKMQMTWDNPGGPSVTFPVVLTNNASTGSNFTLGSTTVGLYSYQGTGSVNSTIASASIIKTDTAHHTWLISLNNFNKQ